MDAVNASCQLSVVMPALNEERNLAAVVSETLDAFRNFSIQGEIVVVNDGSTDRTAEVAERMRARSPEAIRVLTHDKPRGIGASFWEAVACARGNAVVMLPGDNENDPRETLRYFRLLEHVDIVIPFLFNRQSRSLFRNFLSFVYRFIINTTFFVNFNYTNGTVLYRTSVLRALATHAQGFFFQTDILIRLVKEGYLFAEVPYKVGVRKGGVSKAISFPSLLQVVRGYLRLVYDYYFRKSTKALRIFSDDSQTAIRRRGESAP